MQEVVRRARRRHELQVISVAHLCQVGAHEAEALQAALLVEAEPVLEAQLAILVGVVAKERGDAWRDVFESRRILHVSGCLCLHDHFRARIVRIIDRVSIEDTCEDVLRPLIELVLGCQQGELRYRLSGFLVDAEDLAWRE